MIQEYVKEIYDILGPGFSERVYHNAMEVILRERGISYETERIIPIVFKGHTIGNLRADIIINKTTVVELKTVKNIKYRLGPPTPLKSMKMVPRRSAPAQTDTKLHLGKMFPHQKENALPAEGRKNTIKSFLKPCCMPPFGPGPRLLVPASSTLGGVGEPEVDILYFFQF